MRLFQNAVWSLVTSVASMPVYLVTSIVLARYLSVEDRGLYGVAIAAIGTTALLSEMGWGPATIYRLRRVKVPAGRVTGSALAAVTLASAVIVGGGLALDDWLRARFLDGAPERVLLLVLACIPLQICFGLFGSIARGLDRFPLYNGSTMLLNVGRLAGMALFLVVLGGALDEALGVYLGVLAAVTLGLGARVIAQTGIAAPEAAEMRESLWFGLRLWVTRAAGQLHERVDVFMIIYMLQAPREVAFYTIALALVAQLRVLPESVGRALYPQLAGTPDDQSGGLAARVNRHSFAWVVLAILVVAPVAPWVLPLLYGEEYARSVGPFLIMLPGLVFYSRYRVLANYFGSQGVLRPAMVVQILAVLSNVALNYVMIPRWGINGAALASVISHGGSALLLSILFQRESGVGFGETVWLARADWEPYQRRLRTLRARFGNGR